MRISAVLTILFASTAALADPASEMRPLGNCETCVLENSDFSARGLVGVDLSDAVVTGVRFSGSNMSIAVLDGATLTDVNFDGTNLRGASFVNTRMTNVTFGGADLTGAVFEGAVMTASDLTAARLCQTQMPDDSIANSGCR